MFIRMCGHAEVVGKELVCRRKRGNSHNVYGVSVMKDSVIIGHFPRKTLPIASLPYERWNNLVSSSAGIHMFRSV